MKRDFELIRDILRQVEDTPAGKQVEIRADLEKHDEPTVCEHVKLLEEAGLIEAQICHGSDGEVVAFHIMRLTMAGHDFVSLGRNETIWRKFTDKVKSLGSSVSLKIASGLLENYAKAHLGL